MEFMVKYLPLYSLSFDEYIFKKLLLKSERFVQHVSNLFTNLTIAVISTAH